MESFFYLFVVAVITFGIVIFIVIEYTMTEIQDLKRRLDILENKKYLIVEDSED